MFYSYTFSISLCLLLWRNLVFDISVFVFFTYLKIVQNRVKIEFSKKDIIEEFSKQQSKLNFNRTQKSYTSYDSFWFEQNEVPMDKPIY